MAQLQWCDHDDFVHINDFVNYYDDVIKDFFKSGREVEMDNYLRKKDEFMEMLKSDEKYKHDSTNFSYMPEYPYWVVKKIVTKIKDEKKNICPNDKEFLKQKFTGYEDAYLYIGVGGGNSISEAGISEAVRAGISEAGISEAGISITNPVVALVTIAVERHDCTDH